MDEWVEEPLESQLRSRSYAWPFNGLEVSKSSISIVNKIMSSGKTKHYHTWGVWIINARKRRVMEQITRRLERDGVFDVVVKKNTWWQWWSKSPDLRKIQGELGNKLGLQLHDKATLEDRASCLCDRIKMEEKILIILVLDDLRGQINLATIGIPFGNDHKDCKILLVAETQQVLSNQINGPQKTITI